MIDPTYLQNLVEEAVASEDAFLIDLTVKQGENISVLIDHEEGLTLERVTNITRQIRRPLDEEEYDYHLEVSSPGVGEPLQVPQQYAKNVGRQVELTTKEGETIKALFDAFEDDVVHLSYKVREPKPVGKGKVTVTKKKTYKLDEIDTLKVLVTF